MSNIIWADPQRLRGQEPKFTNLANQISTAASTLQSVLSAEGQCWGQDEPGQQFAKGYLGTSGHGDTDGHDRLTALVTAFQALAKGTVDNANAYEAQEQQNKQNVQGT